MRTCNREMRSLVGQEHKHSFQMPKRKMYGRVKVYFYDSNRQQLENRDIFGRYISGQYKYI